MRLLPGLEEGHAQGGGGRIALALRGVVALLLALLITSCGGGGATVTTGAVPPMAPGSLTVELTPNGDALLRWRPPAPGEDRSPVTGYRVYLESTGGQIRRLGDTRSLSYRHQGLQAGERYVYHIRALSAAGQSPPSESVYVDVPHEPVQRPDAPGSLTAEFVPTGEVLLRWTAPPPAPNRASVTGYRVFQELGGGELQTLGETRSLSYRHRGLQPGERYVYHVRALSTAGESPPSESAVVDVPPSLVPPEAPGSFTAELAANGREALLRWAAPAPAEGRAAVTRYEVYHQPRAGQLEVLGTTQSLSYRHQGLRAGQRYVYHVRAWSRAGRSLPSASAAIDLPPGLLPPNAPGSLRVELIPGNEAGLREALLQWTAPAPAADRAPVTGYEIYREGMQSPIETTDGALSFRVTRLSPGTRYVYYVRALSAAAGRSLPSESAYVDVPPGLVPPEPPRSLSATLTPENDEILLQWTAPVPAEDRAPVTGYEIYRKGTQSPIGKTDGVLSFRDTDLIPGTRHFYHVLAVGAGNRKSRPSESVFVDVPSAQRPQAPRSLTARLISDNDNNVLLHWDAPAPAPGRAPIESYEICIDNVCDPPLGTTRFLSYRYREPSPGTHIYQVLAVNAVGKSPPSASFSLEVPEATTLEVPEMPGSLAAELTSDGDVLLRWKAPTPASDRAPVTGYRVYRKAGNAAPDDMPEVIGRTTGALSFLDTEVTLGRSYVYHVVALSAAGSSDPSASVSFQVPLLLAPEAPGSFTAELTANGEAVLRWRAPAPAEGRAPVTGYRVYYQSTSGGNLQCLPDVTGGALSYLHSGLSPGTYVYHVRALSGDTGKCGEDDEYSGASVPSTSAFVEVPGLPGLPLATPHLSVRAYDDERAVPDRDNKSNRQVRVSWIQPLSDPPSTRVSGFNLQFCKVIPKPDPPLDQPSDHCNDGWQSFIVNPAVNDPTFNLESSPARRLVNDVFDCDLEGGNDTTRPARMYRIQALSTDPALSSPWSATVGPVCPDASYSPPRRVDAVFVEPEPGATFNVCWEVPVNNNDEIKGYELQMSPDEALPETEDGWWVLDAHVRPDSTLSDDSDPDGPKQVCRLYSGLVKDDERWFRIRAYNRAGHGDWSAPYHYAHKPDQPVPSSSRSAPGSEGVLSVADARAVEREGARLRFEVRLESPVSAPVSVDYATEDGSAQAGEDYVETAGSLLFAPGEAAKEIEVPVIDDARDEGEETLTLRLHDASGARIADAEATGTIENDDQMPAAWLSRFGRTVAAQTVHAMDERFASAPASHVSVGGISLGVSELREAPPSAGESGRVRWPEETGQVRTLSGEELLRGSAFHLSTPGEGGPVFSAWGRFASSGIDAESEGLRLDGDVTTAFLGMDVDGGRWLAGALLSHSDGEGTFRLGSGDAPRSAHREETESTLTGLYPYARLALGERVSLWGLAGGGRGSLTLTGSGGAPLETDIDMAMGALGARAALLSPAAAGGLALDLRSDAFWTQTSSDALRSAGAGNLASTRSDANRVRLFLEGERPFALDAGGTLIPSLEVGVRHDGGDAETGVGFEVGAGLRYAGAGISIAGALRTLVAHQESGYEEWEASGQLRIDPRASGHGLSLSLTPVLSGRAGTGERPWWDGEAWSPLAGNAAPGAGRRIDGELGYGLGLSGVRGLFTPYTGVSIRTDGGREWRLGTRWAVTSYLTLSLEGARRQVTDEDDAVQALVLRGALRH